MSQCDTPAAVDADPRSNIAGLLAARADTTPTRVLFAVPERGGWRDISARDFESQVIAVAKGFIAAGVEPGDRIALLARTTYEWTLIDFALFYVGAVMVPIYETSSVAQIAWILEDSEARACITETPEHGDRLRQSGATLGRIRSHWELHEGALAALVEEGSSVPTGEVTKRRALAGSSDVATLVYTSGSTGRPKGCVLTHGNFVDLARNGAVALAPLLDVPGASTLLFLPAAHVFARFISIVNVHVGVRTAHEPDTKRLMGALASFRPTFLLAVPRVFEKIFNVAEQRAAAGGHARVFDAAVETAVKYSACKEQGLPIPLTVRLLRMLFDKLVYAKVRAAVGGRVVYAISGSAPLSERLGHFFRCVGITVLEGYGLTETTAPATVNLVEKSRTGTVGPPLPGVGVKIADDGEVMIRGVNVFRGYLGRSGVTANSLIDGWFATGDLGELDAEGFLRITGRKKEIIVTAGGKNVAPAALEDAIREHPLVDQVLVVGEQRPYVAALVTLDAEMLPGWLRNEGLPDHLSVAEAAEHPHVRAGVQAAVDAANRTVSQAESVRRFDILADSWTQEGGELTPKLTVKRAAVSASYASRIGRLYAAARESAR